MNIIESLEALAKEWDRGGAEWRLPATSLRAFIADAREEPVGVERFADNGEHSHWELVDRASGRVIASEVAALSRPSTDKLRLAYDELLYAVETKYDGENRYATAFRYIREAEARMVSGQASDAVLAGEKGEAPFPVEASNALKPDEAMLVTTTQMPDGSVRASGVKIVNIGAPKETP